MTNEDLKKKIVTIIDSEFENRCRKTNCRNCDLYPDEMCQLQKRARFGRLEKR